MRKRFVLPRRDGAACPFFFSPRPEAASFPRAEHHKPRLRPRLRLLSFIFLLAQLSAWVWGSPMRPHRLRSRQADAHSFNRDTLNVYLPEETASLAPSQPARPSSSPPEMLPSSRPPDTEWAFFFQRGHHVSHARSCPPFSVHALWASFSSEKYCTLKTLTVAWAYDFFLWVTVHTLLLLHAMPLFFIIIALSAAVFLSLSCWCHASSSSCADTRRSHRELSSESFTGLIREESSCSLYSQASSRPSLLPPRSHISLHYCHWIVFSHFFISCPFFRQLSDFHRY